MDVQTNHGNDVSSRGVTNQLFLSSSNNNIYSFKMVDKDHLVKKKMKFLGSWINHEVTKDVMGKILQLIQSEKGSKVKLELTRDGLRVIKNQIISGMVLQNFIPLKSINVITNNQNVPRIMFVVSKEMHTYQIYTFKCENALDAGVFIQGLWDIRRTVDSVTKQEHNSINWTFGSKTEDDKRQLNKLEDIYDVKAVVQLNGGDVHQPLTSPRDRIQKQNKKIPSGKQFHNKTTEKAAKPVLTTINAETKKKIIEVNTKTNILLNATPFSDSASEVSKHALHSELESLSNEVGDIKLMLHKLNGCNLDDTEKHNNEDAFEAIVLLDEEDEIDTSTKIARRPRTENKTKPVQNGPTEDGLVRISVPNYRYNRKKRTTAGGHVLILPCIIEELL